MVESVITSTTDNILIRNIGLLPFNRAVSKYNIEEDVELDIVTNSRKMIDYKLNKLINITAIDQTTRFQPIIGGAGCGKTHYYWILKSRERKRTQSNEPSYKTIYISSPPTPYRLYHHIYTCLADELADERFFLYMIDAIFEELKIDSITVDITDPKILIAKVLPTFPGIFADCIKALIFLRKHGSANIKGALALRWLLGEGLTENEQKELQINSILEQDDVCLAMIKIISDLTQHVLIFYFDEMESPYRTFGPEAQQKFFAYIKRIYNELRNSIIITACLQNIWGEILKTADEPMLQRMEPALTLENFNESDLKVYYLRAMNRFWISFNHSPKDTYYPLKNKIIDEIYIKSKGNPRECIKNIKYSIENYLLESEKPSFINSDSIKSKNEIKKIGDKYENSNSNYQNYLKSIQNPTSDKNLKKGNRKLKKMKPNRIISNVKDKENLIKLEHKEKIVEEEEEERDPTPGKVLQVFFKILKEKASNLGKDYSLIIDFSYNIGEKKNKVGAILKKGKKIIGIDVPSVKSFERGAGVAAYYALKRLNEAQKAKIIDKGIILLPSSTCGNKYSSLKNQCNKISEIRINPKTVRKLVNSHSFAVLTLSDEIKKIMK
ncbi:MAG: hypothetical protein GY870_06245 [archaeon]|nr:hypothetical protein [archaeon]